MGKNIIVFGYWILAVIFTLYIALWWGLIQPIINIAEMIDAGTLTAMGVVWQIIKILLREVMTVFVIIIVYSIGMLITGKGIHSLLRKK